MNFRESIAEVNGLGEGAPGSAERRTIPFDYAFTYKLEGVRDKVHNSSVTVSIEANFTAVSIGYGVVPTVDPITFGSLPAPGVSVSSDVSQPQQLLAISILAAAAGEQLGEGFKAGSGTIGPRTAAILKDGIRINPSFLELVLLALPGARALDEKILDEAFQAVAAPPEQIQFLYAIFDDGTGREFQSEPIFNLAGLGTADGTRPFRYFARPIEFGPRSAIRMQIIEKSEFQGDLHVSLQGYKTLGTPGSPTGPRSARRVRRVQR